MHMASQVIDGRVASEGVSISAILAALRDAPVWTEIAEHGRLAESPCRAALFSWRLKFGPDLPAHPRSSAWAIRRRLPPSPPRCAGASTPGAPGDAVERLRPLVVEPSASRWSLPAGARASLLRRPARSTALREAAAASASTHPASR